jgi:hypothetical protein
MIEEADIRIGNLVWYYNLYLIETSFKVEGVLEGFIYCSSLPKNKLPVDKVNPVILETDHLIGFGYVKGDKTMGRMKTCSPISIRIKTVFTCGMTGTHFSC